MKKCQKCNQTYSDETLNFCLEDGTVLISESEAETAENIFRPTEQQTEILSGNQVTNAIPTDKETKRISNEKETVVESKSVPNDSQPQVIKQGVSPLFAYLSVGLLAILVLLAGIGIAFWINFNSKSVSNKDSAKIESNTNLSDVKKSETVGKEDKNNIGDEEDKQNPKPTKEPPVKNDNIKETPKPTPSPTATSIATPAPSPTATSEPEKGKYFVILGSFPQSQQMKARKRLQLARSKGLPARIVNTNSVAGLRNGLLAVVMGPYSKTAAQKALRRARSVSSDAYVKAG